MLDEHKDTEAMEQSSMGEDSKKSKWARVTRKDRSRDTDESSKAFV